jgi:hypothetical protein
VLPVVGNKIYVRDEMVAEVVSVSIRTWLYKIKGSVYLIRRPHM